MKDMVKEEYGYERKQTLANSERYITPELKEKEEAATTTDADVETSSATDAKMIVAAYDISLTDGDSDFQPDE